jgi:nitrogen regulatory protein P-II 1
MKLITAIVRQEKLDELIDVVIGTGGRGLTVTEVRGFGRQLGQFGDAPASRTGVLLPKVRLEILVPDGDADAMLEAIGKHARTGAIGDGKTWVTAVDGVMRVRTGERGPDAV